MGTNGSGLPSIGIERADGRQSTSARGLWNVVLRRGPVAVVIPLGLPKSQAQDLSRRLGDLLTAEQPIEWASVDGQMVLL